MSSNPKAASLFAPRSNLIQVGTLLVPGMDQFRATKEAFVKEANVRPPYLWPVFDENFLDKLEEGSPETSIVAHQFKTYPAKMDLVEQFGHNLETGVWHLFNLLKLQAQGQPGILNVDEFPNEVANMFAIFDKKNDKRWVVRAGWRPHQRCWDLTAHLEDPNHQWRRNFRFLTRQPLSA